MKPTRCPDCIGYGFRILRQWACASGTGTELDSKPCQTCLGAGRVIASPNGFLKPAERSRAWRLPKSTEGL